MVGGCDLCWGAGCWLHNVSNLACFMIKIDGNSIITFNSPYYSPSSYHMEHMGHHSLFIIKYNTVSEYHNGNQYSSGFKQTPSFGIIFGS
jgi:hypothetical protein